MTHRFDCLYINGAWVKSSAGKTLDLINPATRQVFAQAPDGTPEDAQKAIEAAAAAKSSWAAVPLSRRIELMQRALDIFRTYRSEIIELEALELGAPVSFGASAHCDYQFARIESYIREAE